MVIHHHHAIEAKTSKKKRVYITYVRNELWTHVASASFLCTIRRVRVRCALHLTKYITFWVFVCVCRFCCCRLPTKNSFITNKMHLKHHFVIISINTMCFYSCFYLLSLSTHVNMRIICGQFSLLRFSRVACAHFSFIVDPHLAKPMWIRSDSICLRKINKANSVAY